jgi:hypothetical protein
MSSIRMRAMIRRLNVDAPKLAFSDLGNVHAATRTCLACKETAECVDWLNLAEDTDRPTFCPNLRLFQQFLATPRGPR